MSTLTGQPRHVVLDGLRDLPGKELQTQHSVGADASDREPGPGITASAWQVKQPQSAE